MSEQRWTLYVCPECGASKLDSGNMVIHSRRCSGEFVAVEVVPASELEQWEHYASDPQNPLFDDGWAAGYKRGKAVRKSSELCLSLAREQRLREALKGLGNAYGCFAGCTASLPGGGPDKHTPTCKAARDALSSVPDGERS